MQAEKPLSVQICAIILFSPALQVKLLTSNTNSLFAYHSAVFIARATFHYVLIMKHMPFARVLRYILLYWPSQTHYNVQLGFTLSRTAGEISALSKTLMNCTSILSYSILTLSFRFLLFSLFELHISSAVGEKQTDVQVYPAHGMAEAERVRRLTAARVSSSASPPGSWSGSWWPRGPSPCPACSRDPGYEREPRRSQLGAPESVTWFPVQIQPVDSVIRYSS